LTSGRSEPNPCCFWRCSQPRSSGAILVHPASMARHCPNRARIRR
jgi:hypothetical protein